MRMSGFVCHVQGLRCVRSRSMKTQGRHFQFETPIQNPCSLENWFTLCTITVQDMCPWYFARTLMRSCCRLLIINCDIKLSQNIVNFKHCPVDWTEGWMYPSRQLCLLSSHFNGAALKEDSWPSQSFSLKKIALTSPWNKALLEPCLVDPHECLKVSRLGQV